VTEAAGYLADGEFPRGSMGPKVEAAIGFLERGGEEVLITSPASLLRAIGGDTGTRIVPDQTA
jgi:carbamate kinase